MINNGGVVENFNSLLRDINLFEEKEDLKKLYLDLQRARNQFICFNDCFQLTDFIRKLAIISPADFGIQNDSGYINKGIYSLSILDSEYNLRDEWRNYLFKNTGEKFLKKRFSKLINLCLEIEKKEENNLGLKCYIFFRMDTVIRNPITSIIKFKEELAVLLQDKFEVYKDRFIELFKEFYEKVKAKGKYKVCNNCGYWDDTSNKHVFCKENKFKEIELGSNDWIIKESVYKDYTSVGLIERDVFDRLKKEGFEVILYPDIEREGDLKVIIYNKQIFIDCKSYSDITDLVDEIKRDKYLDRVIVVPDIYYKEHKEYIEAELPNYLSRKFLNIDNLIKYLKVEGRKVNE